MPYNLITQKTILKCSKMGVVWSVFLGQFFWKSPYRGRGEGDTPSHSLSPLPRRGLPTSTDHLPNHEHGSTPMSSCLLVLIKSTWRDPISRSSSLLLLLMKLTWRDPGSCLLVFSSWWNRLDEIMYLVFLSTRPEEVDLTRSRILSSCLLILIKSTWQDSGSCLLVFSSWRSRLDEIRDLFFLSSRPEEVDLTRFRILSSCLLILIKSTWRDLAFLSSRPDEVDLTRFRILSSCLLILIKSTRRDPGSYLLVFSSWRSRLDEIEDLVFLISCLVFLSSWLIFSSSLLVFAPWFISSSGGTFKLPYKNSTWRDIRTQLLAFLDPRSRKDEKSDLDFSPSGIQEVEWTRCRILPSRLFGAKKSSWRAAGSRLLVFLDPRSRVNEMPDLVFLPFWTQEVELTRCRISSSRLLGRRKSSWRDTGSLLLAFLNPRSRVDEMPDLAFASSWTQEVELTRCRISSSRHFGPKKSSWRDAVSCLLVFLDPGSRVDKIPDLSFLPSWTQEVELTRCRISPSRILGPKKTRRRET